jgi:hypothetical protein
MFTGHFRFFFAAIFNPYFNWVALSLSICRRSLCHLDIISLLVVFKFFLVLWLIVFYCLGVFDEQSFLFYAA